MSILSGRMSYALMGSLKDMWAQQSMDREMLQQKSRQEYESFPYQPDSEIPKSPEYRSRGRSSRSKDKNKSEAKEMKSNTISTTEYLFKVLVIGDLATGKTSFIKRYVHHSFNVFSRATIGVDYALKIVRWSKNSLVRVQLWDIAGEERFGQMTHIYYKDAVGAFIVFDVSDPKSFEAVLKWKKDLDSKRVQPDGSNIPCVLLANKCDQEKAGTVSDESFLDTFCDQHGFCGWFYTSPKTNVNVEESCRFLIKQVIASKKAQNQLDGEASICNSISDPRLISLAYDKGKQHSQCC